MDKNQRDLHVVQADVDAYARSLRSQGTPWSDGCARVLESMWKEVKGSRQPSFQTRVAPWMQKCFGPVISNDVKERNHRFLEESLELVQSTGCTASEAHQLVDYVYGRPKGESHQEVGGVMVTLAALCLALGLDMHNAGEDELARIWTKIEKIRTKQAAKPDHSPLPETPSSTNAPVAWLVRRLPNKAMPGCYSVESVGLDRAKLIERGFDESEIVPLYIPVAASFVLPEDPTDAMLDGLLDRIWREHTAYTVWDAFRRALVNG